MLPNYLSTPIPTITPDNRGYTVVILNVSINKHILSFQNCFVFLSRLCQGKGWKTFSHFKRLLGELWIELALLTQKNIPEVNLCHSLVALSFPCLKQSWKGQGQVIIAMTWQLSTKASGVLAASTWMWREEAYVIGSRSCWSFAFIVKVRELKTNYTDHDFVFSGLRDYFLTKRDKQMEG